ncbi:hypothetical protein HPP92_022780 [Vanilla planifolia]|uniref:allene-oxide cyclase n=1 Tax=Vanilla planifolia TaxID=51239 RepID=A0A835UFE8_VANPL|nr:hypothetical protein HPP92_022780 [Vanilla planifolia]
MATYASFLKLGGATLSIPSSVSDPGKDFSETKMPLARCALRRSLNPKLKTRSSISRSPIRPVSASLFSHKKSPVDSSRSSKVQELHLYEINERDRESPAYLRLSQKQVNSLGDLVPSATR